MGQTTGFSPFGPGTPAGDLAGYRPATDPWERTYAMVTHLMLIASHFVPVVPTLIMWLVKRDQSRFVDDHGKEAVNFQVSLILYLLASGAMVFCGVGVVLAVGVWVLGIVGMVRGAIAAHGGRLYRYPMCLRLVR